MAVSKRLRFEILRRDNHTCRYCGAGPPDIKLVVDHVVPETLGGRTEPSNLVTACEGCNSGKSATSPVAAVVANVDRDALRWTAAIQRAGAEMLAERMQIESDNDEFRKYWQAWLPRFGPKTPYPLPPNWSETVHRFFGSGLPQDFIYDAVDVAMTRSRVDDRFRYFCGIVWGRIREMHDRALANLDPQHLGPHDRARRRLALVLDRCDPPLSPWEYDRIILELTDQEAGA